MTGTSPSPIPLHLAVDFSPPTVIELLLGGVLLIAVWAGYQSGFVAQIASLFRLIASLLVASRFFSQLVPVLQHLATIPVAIGNLLSFAIIFIATMLVLTWLYRVLLDPIISLLHVTPGLGFLDRLLGILFAIIQELFWIAALLTLVLLLPFRSSWQDAITQSPWSNTLVVLLSRAEQYIQAAVGSLSVPLLPGQDAFGLPARDTESTITMHFPQGLPITEDRRAEQVMFNFVNHQRAETGLAPLTLDPALSRVAFLHSKDMFERDYFGHVTPTGQTPFQRLQEAGIVYLSAGENIAFAPTVYVADIGLMNSPPHRRNILEPAFHKVGIGVASGGIFGEMFTQDFTN